MCDRQAVFPAAVGKQLVSENPFADMKGIGVRQNLSREFFVTPEATAELLAAAPESQWRVIIALARYGGLRCPSELLALRLGDID